MFWCPVSAVQPTEKGKVHAHRRQAVVKVIPKMLQLTGTTGRLRKASPVRNGVS